jgi:hypothetical protein
MALSRTTTTASARGGLGLLEQSFSFGQGRLVPHGDEQLAGFCEWLVSTRITEGEEAATLAEQGVRALGDVAEPFPPLGRLPIEPRRSLGTAPGLGELRLGRDLSVVVGGASNLETFGETLGERRLAEGERVASHPAEIGRLKGAEFDGLTEERMRSLPFALDKQEAGTDAEGVADHARQRRLTRCADQLVEVVDLLASAAFDQQADLECAQVYPGEIT